MPDILEIFALLGLFTGGVFFIIRLLTRWAARTLTGQIETKLRDAECIINEKQVPESWLRPYHKRMEAIHRQDGSVERMERIGHRARKHCLRQIDGLIRFFQEASYFDTPQTRATLLRSLQETRDQWATESWRTLMGLEVNITSKESINDAGGDFLDGRSALS